MSMNPTSIGIPFHLKEVLQKHAQAQGRPVSNLITTILLEYIKNPPPWSNCEYRGEFQ